MMAWDKIQSRDWDQVITTLPDRVDVSRIGQKRGTRYHSQGGTHA
jgi:hypothetical protein